MTTNERTAPCQEMPSQQTQVQPHAAANILPKRTANVKNPLRRLRITHNLMPSAIVAQVREVYPGFDLGLYAKCERTEQYGIQLANDAMEALTAQHEPQQDKPKADTHKWTGRVSCRLSDSDYESLRQLVQSKGYDTMQAFLHKVLKGYIRRWEEQQHV